MSPLYDAPSDGSRSGTPDAPIAAPSLLKSSFNLPFSFSLSSTLFPSEGDSAAVDVDYESLPDGAGPAIHMLAGALAGISEHCITYPLDAIKTRMQVVNPDPRAAYTSLTHAFSTIQSSEGLAPLWRGVVSVVVGAGPAHALYFGAYESSKEWGRTTLEKHQKMHLLPFVHAGSGAIATILADAIMTPFDVIKQRMQLLESPYASVWSCAKSVYRQEGLSAFYVSYPTTLLMSIPFQAIQFTTYEAMQSFLNPLGTYSPLSHVTAGALSGAVASALTTPIDVIKTVLQTRGAAREESLRRVHGLRDAMQLIYRVHGWRGYWRGMGARVASHVPATAACWTTYEWFKWMLRQTPSRTVTE